MESFDSLWLGSHVTITWWSLADLALLPSALFTECFGHRALLFKHDNHHVHSDADNGDDDINVPLEEKDFLAEPLLSSKNNDFFASSVSDDDSGIHDLFR